MQLDDIHILLLPFLLDFKPQRGLPSMIDDVTMFGQLFVVVVEAVGRVDAFECLPLLAVS